MLPRTLLLRLVPLLLLALSLTACESATVAMARLHGHKIDHVAPACTCPPASPTHKEKP
jgi:hypothetical protein